MAALLGTAPALASNAISCTQQGLLDAGFDPNGIDGKIGRGTRAASDGSRNSAWVSQSSGRTAVLCTIILMTESSPVCGFSNRLFCNLA